jgi:hypothetical protein
VSNFTWQFAGEAKSRRGHFDPTHSSFFGGSSVEGGVDLDGRKIAGVKLQPPVLGQVRGIKRAAPVVETPGTGADAYFLLAGEMQREVENNPV